MEGNDYTSSTGTRVMDTDDLAEGKKSTWLQAAVQKLNSPIILPGVKKIHKEKELSISPYVIICATLIVFISTDGQLLRIVGWHYFLLFHKGWSSVSSISGDII